MRILRFSAQFLNPCLGNNARYAPQNGPTRCPRYPILSMCTRRVESAGVVPVTALLAVHWPPSSGTPLALIGWSTVELDMSRYGIAQQSTWEQLMQWLQQVQLSQVQQNPRLLVVAVLAVLGLSLFMLLRIWQGRRRTDPGVLVLAAANGQYLEDCKLARRRKQTWMPNKQSIHKIGLVDVELRGRADDMHVLVSVYETGNRTGYWYYRNQVLRGEKPLDVGTEARLAWMAADSSMASIDSVTADTGRDPLSPEEYFKQAQRTDDST
jgi:hypothetical protein